MFRLALAQMNATVGDLEGNARKIETMARKARALGAWLVAFPELALTGYPPEDLLLKPQFVQDTLAHLDRLAKRLAPPLAIVGFVDRRGSRLYNAAAVIAKGQLVGVYHKQRLPNYGVFDEKRYFEPGAGYVVVRIGGHAIGMNICEDIWQHDGTIRPQVDAGAELIVNINASPYHAGKWELRQRIVQAQARAARVWIAYLNLVGGQDELVFDGGSMIIDPTGQVVARGPQFDEALVVADLDLDGVKAFRRSDPRWERWRLARPASKAGVRVMALAPRRFPAPRAAVHAPKVAPYPYVEEIYRALVLGVRDYLRKNGFTDGVIGLSGGIDSSLTACLAADALGPKHVVGASLPSRFTSAASIEDARLLAKRLGIRFLQLPIRRVHQTYLAGLRPAFKGRRPNVTEENLQARIRGNLLMALSNQFGWLVLTTGNKSEISCGYATLYGDMAGGFNVLKDVFKTTVYRLADYRNRIGPQPVIPQRVIDREPTAELRPNQRDTDSLPPYPLLDPILKAYVEEDRGYQDIVRLGYEPATVKRVIRMVDSSEYKRRQAPPGVKITPKAFGKDWRVPITNRYRGA